MQQTLPHPFNTHACTNRPWFKPAGLPFGQKMAQQYGGKVTIPAYMDWLLKHRKINAGGGGSDTDGDGGDGGSVNKGDGDDDGGSGGGGGGQDGSEDSEDLDRAWIRFMAMVHEKEAEGWTFDEDGSVLTNTEGGRITLLPPPKPGSLEHVDGNGATDTDNTNTNANANTNIKSTTATTKNVKDALPFIFAALPSQAAQTRSRTALELMMNGAGQSLPEIGFGARKGIPANKHTNVLIPTLDQFFLGVNGTGAPLHFHTHAINMLVYGRKRWFAVAPRFEVTARQHVAVWAEDGRKKLQQEGVVVQECIQEQGDVYGCLYVRNFSRTLLGLYIPEFWSHAVLNLAESVGIATEFSIQEPPPIQPTNQRQEKGNDAEKGAAAIAVEGSSTRSTARLNVGVTDEL